MADGLWEDELWTRDETAHWLAFDRLEAGLGAKKIKAIYEYFQTLKAAWTASKTELEETKQLTEGEIANILEKRKRISPQDLMDRLIKSGARALPLHHPLYPPKLRHIFDPPLVLYLLGNLTPEEMFHSVGIVGTRRPSSYGQKNAKEFSKYLASQGANIVSGMALGIDSLAHWGAIEGGGRTVAVLGCGPDICYPPTNKPLYKALVSGEHGAVVSEYFPGTQPDSWRFPARNRIISGMCDAVLVVEAGETSGSLITADLAFSQNRQVFAIPGRIDAPMSKGTNGLIQSVKGQITTSPEQILKEMNWVASPQGRNIPTVVELYGREREVFELLSAEPVHFDVLCEKTGMQAGELSATLTMLELAGVISRLPGDWYEKLSTITTIA